METTEAIESYLAEFRRQSAWIRRRYPQIGDVAHVAWRKTEQATGFEQPGTLVGWLEERNGPPTRLET